MDGFGLLERLRSDDRTRGTPVILLSARAGEGSRSAGIETGANDYLVKPFSARELSVRVAACIKQARSRRIESEKLEREVAVRTKELELRVGERDALLKEVHHRVKNNLHVISSILQLQASRVDDERASAQLEEACNRVISIASIHELLYRRGDFAAVALGVYTQDIAQRLLSFYGIGGRVRVVVVDDDDGDDAGSGSGSLVRAVAQRVDLELLQARFPRQQGR